jgi:chemotaxis protein methyltransferase CheR
LTWQEQLTAMCERYCGVRMPLSTSGPRLERIVIRRVRELGLADADAYLSYVQRSAIPEVEVAQLVDALTTGQTQFFRDPKQMAAVAQVLEDLRGRTVDVWSAGCSTGEEPYTLAMLAAHLDVSCRVLGTDINSAFLDTARAAIYPDAATKDLPAAHRAAVQPVPTGFAVRPAVSEVVEFRRHNLLDAWPPTPTSGRGWDVILCRNVLIYFTRERADLVVGRLSRSLRDGGWLVLGASDPFCNRVPGLEVVRVHGQLLYRRTASSRVVPRRPTPAPPPIEPRPPVVPAPAAGRRRSAATAPRPAASVRPSAGPGRALAYIEAGNLATAEVELRAQLQQRPTDAAVRLSLGNVALARHDFEAARRHYERVAAEHPLLAEVHYLLGLVHRKLGDYAAAKDMLGRALFLDPDFWPAAYLLASCLEREGASGRATAEYRHALTLLEREPTAPLFRSHVAGLRGVDLAAADVARACRRRLRDETG